MNTSDLLSRLAASTQLTETERTVVLDARRLAAERDAPDLDDGTLRDITAGWDEIPPLRWPDGSLVVEESNT